MAESRFQLLFEHHDFLPGSAGDGTHRGVLGGELALLVESDGPCQANTAGDGAQHGAAGMRGGHDGAPHHDRLRRAADGTERVLRTKEVGIVVQPGDRLLVRSGGGGGWGPPEGRDPALRERDAREGYV